VVGVSLREYIRKILGGTHPQPEAQSALTLPQWRDRILTVIYRTVALLGGISYLPSVYLSIKEEIWWLVGFNTLGYLWFLGAAFTRRISFALKAAVLLGFIFILGSGLLLQLGPFAAGPIWLFAFPIMGGLLFSIRVAVACLLINMATIGAFGLLLAEGVIRFADSTANFIAKWWVISGNFLLLDTVVALSLAVLLQGLKDALDAQHEARLSLQHKHAELQHANQNLEHEIAERKRIEVDLQNSHEILVTVIDSIDADIFVADMASYEVLLMNRHMRQNYGGDCTGRACYEAFQKRIGPCEECPKVKLVDSQGIPTGLHVWQARSPLTGRDYLNFDRAIPWIDGRLVQLQIAMDITELNRAQQEKLRLETQLRQAQKMEAIGNLAGGIAHDFNNILAAILGYAEIALEVVKHDPQLRIYLREVIIAAHRARDLTSQILTFSRQAEVEPRPMRLSTVVRESVKLLRATLPTTIDIRETIQTHATIVADPTQMHQVVMNLATNAAHAMEPGGGVLAITLEKSPPRLGAKAADWIQLEISDTGRGIPAEIRDRIFEPYFTTKEKGKGTGLGLAVVHGIVKTCGGEIRVESRPGEGTRFIVALPTRDHNVHRLEELDQGPAPGGTAENIMIVDDEPQITEVLRLMLGTLGYRTQAFNSSRAALQAFEAAPHSYHAVITDMTMPDMTGVSLAQHMLKMRPELPIILATGFSERINEDQALALGIRKFLLKPILRRQLAEAVREVLRS
jgi:signal transduction histidine kinase